jgi:hypothetical protein
MGLSSVVVLLVYLLSCLGVAYAWSDTEISVPIRNLVARIPYIRNALLCHECSSFWISLGLSFLINPLKDLDQIFPFSNNLMLAFCGFFANLYFTRKNIIPLKD